MLVPVKICVWHINTQYKLEERKVVKLHFQCETTLRHESSACVIVCIWSLCMLEKEEIKV